MACDIPVIVWKKSALADYVEENKIGITIDSLDEIDTILNNMKKNDYLELLKNVKIISNKVTKGKNIIDALSTIEKE